MKNTIKKILAKSITLAMVFSFSAIALPAGATTPNWIATGNYVADVMYQDVAYSHDIHLIESLTGDLTGNGRSPAGSNTYTYDITSGSVIDNSIDFHATYTAPSEAVTPQTVMHMKGIIASNGTISGTWSDNYQGGERNGTWATTSGKATVSTGDMSAEDFGVVNYDSGLGILRGYTAGFGLTDATFSDVQSVVVSLYAGDVLLQTNTATAKVGAEITGTQISSPFDVSGTFDYDTDGYWVNVRSSEYGQSVPATRVVATVVLASGKELTARNTNLSGDPSTIYASDLPDGQIGGVVVGGSGVGILGVTSVQTVTGNATANGTFLSGWKYVFNITIPTDETHLAMKFANWKINGGLSVIPVADNIRISSAQADNDGATILLSAANTYSTPMLHMTEDLNPSMDGIQVKVVVESAIPLNSINGSYTTSYGVKTE